MLFQKKKRDIISLQIFERRCIGCESCVDRCRREVLSMECKDDRYFAKVEFPDKCTGCGKCLRNCPTRAIEFVM